MIIDCYYRFEKNENGKSKTRFDLAAFSDTYEPLHKQNAKGEVFLYLSHTPERVTAHQKRKSDFCISTREGYVSAVYVPDIQKPHLAFGDVRNTQDAMLFMVWEKAIEIFIAKGKRNVVNNLFNLLYDGELETEIAHLKEQAGRGKEKQILANVL